MGPSQSRGAAPRSAVEDDGDWEAYGTRRRRSIDGGFHARNPNFGFNEGRNRIHSGGDNPRNMHYRNPYGGAGESFERPASCWDPPQRYQSHAQGFETPQRFQSQGAAYDMPERLKMRPPRFDGRDASNWISRVQYYFDHLMMPEAQRFHYAVRLFDQPAADWVFNYCANNDFVSWQDFLEDVRHRFDRQSFKEYFDQVGWDDRRDHRQQRGFEEYPRGHQHLHNGRAEQPTYRSPQSDRLLSHGKALSPADAPPRSGFTHQPQQSTKCIDSEWQHDLPNTPNIMVRSPCVNALFEENIDDVNLAEDAPVSVGHEGGANLVVPNDESLEEIVKPDNTPLQVLVGVYDEKCGEEDETLLEDKEETLLEVKEENGSIGEVEKIIAPFNVAQMSLTVGVNCWFMRGGACTGVRIIAYFYVDFVDDDVPSIVHRSTSLDVDARFIPPCNDAPYLSVLGDEYSLISKVVLCSHDIAGEKNIVEDKWKENEMGPNGLVGSKGVEDNDIFWMIKVIMLRVFDPGRCASFSKRKYGFLPMPMEKSDLLESEKELPLEGFIKCLFASAETFRIELHVFAKHVVFTNARKLNRDDEGKRSAAQCVFDPGGDYSPKLLLSNIVVATWFPNVLLEDKDVAIEGGG